MPGRVRRRKERWNEEWVGGKRYIHIQVNLPENLVSPPSTSVSLLRTEDCKSSSSSLIAVIGSNAVYDLETSINSCNCSCDLETSLEFERDSAESATESPRAWTPIGWRGERASFLMSRADWVDLARLRWCMILARSSVLLFISSSLSSSSKSFPNETCWTALWSSSSLPLYIYMS